MRITLPLVVAFSLLGSGCALCWPRGGGMALCSGDDDDDAGDDDDATDPADPGMVAIPAGTYAMGCHQELKPAGATCSSEELPVHTVTISAFQIDAFEVTSAQYVEFLNAHGNDCVDAPCLGGFADPEVDELDGVWVALDAVRQRPIVEVTWYGAEAYCVWAGKRLPTEAEWERAARGDVSERFPWGSDAPDCNRAIFGDGCGEGRAWDVDDGFRDAGRSPFGVWDLGGNVWEYVSDRFDADYYEDSPEIDPQGPVVGDSRVVRGGGWESNEYAVEAWSRWGRPDFLGNASVGLRCATDR